MIVALIVEREEKTNLVGKHEKNKSWLYIAYASSWLLWWPIISYIGKDGNKYLCKANVDSDSYAKAHLQKEYPIYLNGKYAYPDTHTISVSE